MRLPPAGLLNVLANRPGLPDVQPLFQPVRSPLIMATMKSRWSSPGLSASRRASARYRGRSDRRAPQLSPWAAGKSWKPEAWLFSPEELPEGMPDSHRELATDLARRWYQQLPEIAEVLPHILGVLEPAGSR